MEVNWKGILIDGMVGIGIYYTTVNGPYIIGFPFQWPSPYIMSAVIGIIIIAASRWIKMQLRIPQLNFRWG